MTNEPSPRPWRVDESIGGWRACVSDKNGNPVASCWGGGPTEQQEKAEAIAALIVDAVNERDRLRAELADRTRNYEDVIAFHTRTEEHLRDIVRRLISLVNWIEQNDAGAALLREARAAIGEGQP